MKRRTGFTLVELLVVIVVIGILSTITILTYNQYQKMGRDNRRHASAVAIANALEDYYSNNGEYPGCSQLTGDPNTVTAPAGALSGLEKTSLVTPLAPSGTTNSLKCQPLTSYSQSNDFFSYTGDSSSTCTTSPVGSASCLQFTLSYIDEETGSIDSISSKHKESIDSSGTISVSTSNISYTSLQLNWNTLSNATGYIIQEASNSSFTSGLSTISTSTSPYTFSSLSPGTQYFFRIQATSSNTTSAWSNTVSPITLLAAPQNNNVTAPSATTLAQTWNAVTGATSYTFQCSTDGSTWGPSICQAAGNQTSYTYGGAVQGQKYWVRVEATTSAATSPWSNVASVVTPINTPAAPGWAGPSSMKASVQGGAYYYYAINYNTSCPAGSSVYNGNFTSEYTSDGSYFNHPFGYNDYWYLPYGQTSTTIYYWGRYQCQTAYATSAASPDTFTSVTVNQ